MALLVTNSPLGWACLAVGPWAANHTGNPRWLAWGAAGYGFTWLMFGGAFLLLGAEGIRQAKARKADWIRRLLPLRTRGGKSPDADFPSSSSENR